MKRILVLVTVCLSLCAGLHSQTALLGDFDFSQGGYSLLIVPADESFVSRPDTTQFASYFDSPKSLNEIKSQLVFEEEATQYPFACFASCDIVVCKNGKAEELLSISNNCHAISSSKGEFAYLGFFPFKGYKMAVRKSHKFEQLTEARAALDSLLRLPGLIYIPDPEWREFDGKFAFFREDVEMERDEVHRELKEAMERRYPGEKFELVTESSGGSSGTGWDYWAEVRCRKSLFDRFDLFKFNQRGWQPFPLTLQSYWKK